MREKFVPELFYNEGEAEYYWVGVPSCNFCNKIPEHFIWVSWAFTSRKASVKLSCNGCRAKIFNDGSRYSEIKRALIKPYSEIPENSVLAIPETPTFTGVKDTTIWDAHKIESDITKDRGILWKRDDNMVTSNFKTQKQINSELKDKDRLITSEAEADELLNELMNAEPVIEEDEKKRLEAK